jgi:hypothetical protein
MLILMEVLPFPLLLSLDKEEVTELLMRALSVPRLEVSRLEIRLTVEVPFEPVRDLSKLAGGASVEGSRIGEIS